MIPEAVPDELRRRLDSLPTPLVLVDATGLIAFVNTRAAQALAPADGARVGARAAVLPLGWAAEHRASACGAPEPRLRAFTPFTLTDTRSGSHAITQIASAHRYSVPDGRPGVQPHVPTETSPRYRDTAPPPAPSGAGAPPRTAPPVGLFTVGPDRRILSTNRTFCEITGYPAHELHWVPLGDILLPEDRTRGESLIAAVAAGQAAADETDLWFRRADGAPVLVQIEATALDDACPARVNVLAHDRTGQRAADERLLRLQSAEMVGLRASCLAHDFNNLLTVINGCVTLLLEGTSTTGPAHPLAQQVTAACERAAELTAQLSTLHRPATAEPEVVELNAIAAGAIRLLRPLLGTNVSLVSNFTASSRVRVEPIQIEQAVLNLAINAKDAMPEGGTLAVETHTVRLEGTGPPGLSPGVYAQLTVTDTGHGMTDEVKARAFEPFFTTKGAGKGTGLGLAAVHAAAERVGGGVRVYSEAGVGTAFELLLPVVATGTTLTTTADHPSAKRTGTVLIVGTDAGRKLARLALKSQGHEVLGAADGHAALRLAREHPEPIDLALVGDTDRALADDLRQERPDIKVALLGNEDSHLKPQPVAPGSPPSIKGSGPFSLVRVVQTILCEPN